MAATQYSRSRLPLIVRQKRSAVQRFQHVTELKGGLCLCCERLDLDFDNFVVSSKKGQSFVGEYPMGRFSAIWQRSCPLCTLLTHSLMGERFDPQTDGDPSCSLSWTPDGMKRVSNGSGQTRTVHLTRRLQIVWRKTSSDALFVKSSDKSHIVLVAPEARFDESTLFLGRLFTTVMEFEDSYDLANKWLNVCLSNHGDQCAAISSLESRARDELVRNPSFVVVDVHDMCLVALPRGKRYAALSYTWGVPGEESEETKRWRCDNDNAQFLQQKKGITTLMTGLPMGIQNAIKLTKRLGIGYLWVDSLCITQENDYSWANNAAVMDVIYGNAILTLCAADDDSKRYGLKTLSKPTGSKWKRHATQLSSDYQKKNGKEKISLMLSHPSESYIARSRWEHRCWTLQERLLSPRCLIFVEGRMYFQCRCTTMSEDIYSDDAEAIAGWSVELHGSPALILKKVRRSPINVYKELIEMYTLRDLSKEKDILNAFKGITNLVTDSLGENCEMIYGLPNSHFDWGLLWSSEIRLQRRTGNTSGPPKSRIETKDFPSWSWCGWKGEYSADCGWRGGRVSYQNHEIFRSETESNLREWLQRQTWITYYISNGQGRLRLIWDPLRHAQNLDSQSWTGYSSPRDWQEPDDAGIGHGIPPKYDLHGREFDSSLPIQGRVKDAERHFKRCLPTSQLSVIVLPPGHDHTKDFKHSAYRPWDETYLQFFTWSARFYIVEANSLATFSRGSSLGNGLKRFAIIDINGSMAGSCVLDERWSVVAKERIPQEFIALSFGKRFTAKENFVDDYYNGPNNDSDWPLYNVMMLEYVEGDRFEIGYRAGLGKVKKNAFYNSLGMSSAWATHVAGRYWKEIVLG